MNDLVKRLRLAAKQDDEAWARKRWAECADTIEALQEKVRVAMEALEDIADIDDDGWTSDGHERCTECAAQTLAQLRSPDHG